MNSGASKQTDKVFTCQRTNKRIPLAEPRCVDPKAYCKWRTACPIRLLEKEAVREAS